MIGPGCTMLCSICGKIKLSCYSEKNGPTLVQRWANALFAVHWDYKSHTSVPIMMGRDLPLTMQRSKKSTQGAVQNQKLLAWTMHSLTWSGLIHSSRAVQFRCWISLGQSSIAKTQENWWKLVESMDPISQHLLFLHWGPSGPGLVESELLPNFFTEQ